MDEWAERTVDDMIDEFLYHATALVADTSGDQDAEAEPEGPEKQTD